MEENLTYDYLHSSEDNLWSILYLTGYLTQARIDNFPDGLTALMIPNAEIREIFESTILKWLNDSAKTWNREQLFYAVWHGNTDLLTQAVSYTHLDVYKRQGSHCCIHPLIYSCYKVWHKNRTIV